MQSVVSSKPATEPAFCNAVRVTLVGSTTPAATSDGGGGQQQQPPPPPVHVGGRKAAKPGDGTGWAMKTDNATGNTYWVHEASGEKAWDYNDFITKRAKSRHKKGRR